MNGRFLHFSPDYQEVLGYEPDELLGRSIFEHIHLLSRQAELNAALDLDKGERQIAPPAGAEGSAEVDGDAGADERAAGVTVRPERREEWRPNRRGQSDDTDADDDKVVVPGRPVSGPKF